MILWGYFIWTSASVKYEVNLRIYRADASNESIYADIYFNFVKDLEERSYLHLTVVVAKENGCVVSACADCIGKIVGKTSELPEYP